MVLIEIHGITELRATISGIQKSVKLEKTRLPRGIATALKRNIKYQIKIGKNKGDRDGPFRRATNKGLANTIGINKQKDGTYIVGPIIDLGDVAGVLSPHEYAKYVEYGTGHSRAKYYFKKGLNATQKELKAELRRTANNIIKK